MDYSIIAVSAVGADPKKTWRVQGSDDSWVAKELLEKLSFMKKPPYGPSHARVLIYNHGEPKEGDDLDSLARRLLHVIIQYRQGDVSCRSLKQ
jgi:hypothetical protein